MTGRAVPPSKDSPYNDGPTARSSAPLKPRHPDRVVRFLQCGPIPMPERPGQKVEDQHSGRGSLCLRSWCFLPSKCCLDSRSPRTTHTDPGGGWDPFWHSCWALLAQWLHYQVGEVPSVGMPADTHDFGTPSAVDL